MPKEMLPVVNKPLIQYGVEEALAAGLTQIAMVTGRGKRSLEDHFDISYELEHQIRNTDKEKYLVGIRRLIDECSFSYTRQVEMKGLGHAILSGRPLIGDEAVRRGAGRRPVHQPRWRPGAGADGQAVQPVPLLDRGDPGSTAGRNQQVRRDCRRDDSRRHLPRQPHGRKAKPEDAPSNPAIIGRYILTPDIFELIEQTEPGKGGEIQITDALMKQAKDGCVLAYKFKGQRFDCGSAEGYIEATNFCYENFYLTGKAF